VTRRQRDKDHFEKIKAKRLANISLLVAAFLFIPVIQFIVQKNYSVVVINSLAQITLVGFHFYLKRNGIYKLGSFCLAALLGTIVFYRCLQGGGIEATTTIWFLSVVASGLVFLERKMFFLLLSYLSLLCFFLYAVTMGFITTPIAFVPQEPYIFLFDIFSNMVILYGLFVINNEIFQEQMSIIREQENALLLQSRLESMGEMAAGIAHEINNPLTIISGRAEIIKHSAQKDEMDSESMLKSADTIKKTVSKIANIVQSLKKLSHGNIDDDKKAIRLTDVFVEVESIIEKMATDAKVQVSFKLHDKELEFFGNFTLLGQVLMNMIKNAIQAIHDQSDKWVRITCVANDEWVTIRVTDSGHGLKPEVAEKIFDPFFTTKSVGEGTGLGLSLCKTAIERMNGKLFVNTESAFTEFVIELPRSKTLDVEDLKEAENAA
jgi:signal transduction histidine kinase